MPSEAGTSTLTFHYYLFEGCDLYQAYRHSYNLSPLSSSL